MILNHLKLFLKPKARFTPATPPHQNVTSRFANFIRYCGFKIARPHNNVIIRLSDLSNGFPDNATEEAGEMEQQTARDLSGEIGRT